MFMKHLVLSLATSIVLTGFTAAQTQDIGNTIITADAELGKATGEIYIASSGSINEGKISLSPGHDLVCAAGTTISLQPGSYIYQSSKTSIKNCTIAATTTPILGEVQSANTANLALDHVTFIGGGNLVYWDKVTNFTIDRVTVNSITAYDAVTNTVQLGIYLLSCSHGTINNLSSPGFIFPQAGNISAVLGLFLCDDVTVNNPNISHVDASYIYGGSLIQVSGSSNITVAGGSLTHSPNCDGITTQSFSHSPSTDITITGVDASYDGEPGQNANAPLGMGDGLDLINSRHVLVSHCICRNSGYLGNQQPAIWLFLDDDIVVENSDLSDSSMGGIDIDGSPDVQLINNTINRNQASGLLAEWQAGTATNVGTAVTFVDGVSGGFGLAWNPGTVFTFDGVAYRIASVSDNTHLTLKAPPPDHSSPANWGVETSNLQITGGTINDNGLCAFGVQVQVGMSWADSTTGTITGVTSIDTGVGTQLFALELANTATAYLSGNTFVPNVLGGNGVSATPPSISPAGLSFASQPVGTTSAAQAVTLTAGAVGIQNLTVQTSGDYLETNDCPSVLPGYTSCQIMVSLSPTASGTRTGTLTASSGAILSAPTVLLTGTGLPQSLALHMANGASMFATVRAGNTAEYVLTIGGGGIGGTASLACFGLPTGMSCSLPATEMISPTQATNFIVTVSTPPTGFSALFPLGFLKYPSIWASLLIGLAIFPKADRKDTKKRYINSLCLVLLASALSSCGSSGNSSHPSVGTEPARAPVVTYALTITAKIGSVANQQPLTLIVEY